VLWGGNEDPGLQVCVRFPRSVDLTRLRQSLIDDPTLDSLPGKGAARRKMMVEVAKQSLSLGGRPEFTLTGTSLVWRRTFAFKTPKAAEIKTWVDTLVAAVGRATPAFDGSCETCGSGVARQFVLVDELPTLMCTSCQQRVNAEGDLADRNYDMIEVEYLPGIALAFGATLVGGLAWGLIGALTEHIFAIAAIGIGALVAWAYRFGAKRVDSAGRMIAAGFTLFSVILGQVLLYTFTIAKLHPEVGVNPIAGLYVYVRMWSESPGEEIVPLFFGLIGAWVATKALARPKLRSSIEPAGSERKAA
jgi:hypothetical protein